MIRLCNILAYGIFLAQELIIFCMAFLDSLESRIHRFNFQVWRCTLYIHKRRTHLTATTKPYGWGGGQSTTVLQGLCAEMKKGDKMILGKNVKNLLCMIYKLQSK